MIFALGFLVFSQPLYGQYGRFTEWFGVNKIQWNINNCNWRVLADEHVNIYYCEGGRALAEMALSYAESSYDTLKTIFGVEPEARRRVIVYLPGHVQETNIWPGLVPEAVAGWYEDEDDVERTVTPWNGDYGWFKCLVRHEMVHNFQGAIARAVVPDADLDVLQAEYGLPLWWTEGEAEYRAGGHNTCRGISRDILLRDMVLSDRIPTFSYLMESPWGFEHYLIGFEVHRFLAREFGDSLNVILYRNLKMTRDSMDVDEFGNIFERAFKKTYGVNFGELYARFRHYLRLRFLPQYNGARVPISFGAKPFSGPTYAIPIRIYERDGRTVMIIYSGDDGVPKIYRLLVPERDSTGAFKDEETDPPQVIARGGRGGYEEIDPWVDVWNDSLLALAAKDGRSYTLVIRDIRRNSEILRRRFDNLQVLNSPSFSPDGRRIVFSASFYSPNSDSSGVFDLYVYDRETDELRRLTNDIYSDANPKWNPTQDSLILFESDRGEGGDEGYTNLFVLNLETGEIRYLTRGNWHDYYANWSANGSEVLFTSDRDGNYDLYRVFLDGKGSRVTKYWGSAVLGQFLPGDSAIIFSGSSDGSRRLYIQDVREDSIGALGWIFPRDSSYGFRSNRWEPVWQWEVNNQLAAPRPYRNEYRVDGFCGGELLAGYGYGTACSVIVPDFFNDHWFFASFGTSNFSWVPGRGRFNASFGFVDLGGRKDYALYAYYADNPAIDIPIRHAFHETRIGAGALLYYPFSKFFRLEVSGGPEYVFERDLYDWSNPYDLNHSADTINFRTRGFTLRGGVSLVGDNALGISTGPIVGYRYRVGALATVNLSALTPTNSGLSYPPFIQEKEEERQGLLTNYILHADIRHYLRLSMFGTFGLRFFGYYSDGAVPTYVSFGKLNGMAAFYPWNSPYGSKGWMVNSRITVPLVNAVDIDLPILGKISFSGIQGEVFYDFTQTWFRNNNLGPIYCDRGFGLRVPFPIGTMRLDWGRICTIPLGSDYVLPDFYKNSRFGIGFGYGF